MPSSLEKLLKFRMNKPFENLHKKELEKEKIKVKEEKCKEIKNMVKMR